MKLQLVACILAFAPFALGASEAPPASPYVGQGAREIKALSPEDVDAYLSGKGMGLALLSHSGVRIDTLASVGEYARCHT